MKKLTVSAGFGLLIFWGIAFFMLQFPPVVHAVLMASAILLLHSVLVQPAKKYQTSGAE